MSAKGLLLRWAGRLVLRDAVVTAVVDHGPHFRWMRVEGEALRGASWQPGDKVQVLLPGDDVRTLTPFDWRDGALSFLVYLHDGGAMAPWARAVRPGGAVRFVGPSRSLRVPDGPVVLVGDETSIGVAAAIAGARRAAAVVLEVGPDVDATAALHAVGVEATVVRRAADGAHHDAIVERARRAPGAVLITGGDALVRGVRRGLFAKGVEPAKVKAYWVAGRVALD